MILQSFGFIHNRQFSIHELRPSSKFPILPLRESPSAHSLRPARSLPLWREKPNYYGSDSYDTSSDGGREGREAKRRLVCLVAWCSNSSFMPLPSLPLSGRGSEGALKRITRQFCGKNLFAILPQLDSNGRMKRGRERGSVSMPLNNEHHRQEGQQQQRMGIVWLYYPSVDLSAQELYYTS